MMNFNCHFFIFEGSLRFLNILSYTCMSRYVYDTSFSDFTDAPVIDYVPVTVHHARDIMAKWPK